MLKETKDKAEALLDSGKAVEAVAMLTEELCCVENDADEFAVRIWRFNAICAMGDLLGGSEDAAWLLEHMDVAYEALENFTAEKESVFRQELYLILGRKSVSEKNYDKAIGYFNQVLELNSHNVEAYQGRGACYYAMGQMESAKQDLLSYYENNPLAAAELTGRFHAEGRE